MNDMIKNSEAENIGVNRCSSVVKKYPKYKDSGIEWLEEIPEHWERYKLKHTVSVNPSKSSSDFRTSPTKDVVFLPMEKVESNGIFHNDVRKPVQELSTGFTYFEEGDVIFAKITPCFENGKGAFLENLGTDFGFGSTEFHVLRAMPKMSQGKFIYYLTYSHPFRIQGEAFMTGAAGQKRVPTDFASEFLFALPPMSEQQAIAEYLDCKTSKIDKLVSIKEKQIELLKEHRTAIINHYVTGKHLLEGEDVGATWSCIKSQAFDSFCWSSRLQRVKSELKKGHTNSPRRTDVRDLLIQPRSGKDSGIEWLGEIPEHWEELKLKYCSYLKFSNVDKHSYDDEIPVKLCNYTDVYYSENIDDSISFMEATATKEEIEKFTILKGDVLVTKDSEEWTDIAVPAYVACELNNVLCGYHLAMIRPYNIHGKYLSYAFRSKAINHQLQIMASGITRYGIGKYDLDNTVFPIPPREEQESIIDYLDTQSSNIAQSISDAEKQIELLKEYRTALISEAVTGKINVRGTR